MRGSGSGSRRPPAAARGPDFAERLPARLVARLGAVLDQRTVVVQRDGIAQRQSTVIGVIALDEGIEFDEQAPAALRDRLAFHVDLAATRVVEAAGSQFSPAEIAAARRRLPLARVGEEILRGLCAAGQALGIASVRAVLLRRTRPGRLRRWRSAMRSAPWTRPSPVGWFWPRARPWRRR